MEDKQYLDVERRDAGKMKYLGGSVLILSLLLGACVVAVIYMAVNTGAPVKCEKTTTDKYVHDRTQPEAQQQQQQQQQQPEENKSKKDEASLNLRYQDGTEESEDVEYDESRDVAIFHGKNGYFFAEDFEKGINIIKDTDGGHCYVIPVGSNRTAGHQLRDFVKGYQGEEIDMQDESTYRANILPGAIDDTSFLPPEARTACNGFYWLSVVGEATAQDESDRVKRALCVRRYLQLIRLGGRWYYRYINVYYNC